MRKLAYILLLSVLAACAPADVNTPGEVAVKLFSAITLGDNEYVKDNIYISDTIQREVFNSAIDIAVKSKQYKRNTKDFTPSYEVAKEVVDGDNAEVILTGIGPLGNKVRITVKLLRIDGRWKVDGDHGVWH
jgi:hypothetical protein